MVRSSMRAMFSVLSRSAALASLLIALPAAAQETVEPIGFGDAVETVDKVDVDLAKMRNVLDAVSREYGAPLQVEVGRVERRLREGELHLLLNDYLRASIVLLDVVDDPSSKSHPRYDDCVFLLAEALRKSRNYIGARGYYEEILPRVTGERLKDVVLGLLEIAGATDRYENVDHYVARLRQAGTLSRPDVDYIYGKMLFRSAADDAARLTRAHEVFRNVPSGTSVSGPAAYYAGVSLVRLGRFEEALNQFKEARARASTANNPETLKDLASLSIGRLFQELGDTPRSTDAYQEISQTSPYFPDMLYEVAWARVRAANLAKDEEDKKKEFVRALQATELLMATSPDSRLYPEARILQGNLQIRLGAEETAYDTFQTIVDRYDGSRVKLEARMREASDPKQFFEQLIAADLNQVRASTILPPIAVSWALEERSMERTLSVQKDLSESKDFMKEARELVDTLEEALRGEQRFNMFPALATARRKARSLANRVLETNRKLLDLERRIAISGSAASREKIDRLRAETRRIESEIRALPQTEEAVEASGVRIKEEFQATSRRAYKLSYQVASMSAQLVAVEVWLANERERLSPEELALTEERLASARSEVKALEVDLDRVRGEIRRAIAISGGDEGGRHSDRLRQEFARAMSEEMEALRSERKNVSTELMGVLARIDDQRGELGKIDRELVRLTATLDERVAQQVAEVREAIIKEVQRLATHESEHDALTAETDSLLGPVAAETLEAVGQRFRELVIKADVGIIDVAWARKQAETERVNKLIKEEQDRTRELESEFADVLKE